jgi:peptidoglycan/xylan/chitin deacetylase (PgdA/CDA1 family)
MRFWKRCLLRGWYAATYPYRTRRNAGRRAAGQAPIVILTYHRVADDRANPWTISNADFFAQMDWLRRNVELVSLGEAQRRIRERANDQTCVSITFDDGYAINCARALPYLLSHRIPLTYFVCTDPVLKGCPFEQDIARGACFEPNTVEQLRWLAAAGVAIGAHTRTHADLGRISDPARLYDEVVTAGEELQRAIGQAVRYFAFPYGGHAHLNPRVFHLAYDAGYEAVCSAYGGYNFPGDDAFHLQRICVDGPPIRMKNWVTIDPWKERRVRRFFYGPETRPLQRLKVNVP